MNVAAAGTEDTSQQMTGHNDYMNVDGTEDTSRQVTRQNDYMNVAGVEGHLPTGD